MQQRPQIGGENNATSLTKQVFTPRDIMVMTNTLMENCSEVERFEKLSRIHANVKSAFTVATPNAIQVVFDIMLNDENSPQTRLMAALAVLDRAGHGTKANNIQDPLLNVTPKLDEMSMEDMSKMLQDIQKRIDTEITRSKE